MVFGYMWRISYAWGNNNNNNLSSDYLGGVTNVADTEARCCRGVRIYVEDFHLMSESLRSALSAVVIPPRSRSYAHDNVWPPHLPQGEPAVKIGPDGTLIVLIRR